MLSGLKSAALPISLLRVRGLQIRRELQTLGWLHKLLFSFLVIVAIVFCHQVFQKTPSSWYLVFGFWLSALLAQFYRPDKNFIFLNLPNPQRAIFLEYAVLSFPFLLPAFLSPNWFYFFIFL